jgi:hypothetical protein
MPRKESKFFTDLSYSIIHRKRLRPNSYGYAMRTFVHIDDSRGKKVCRCYT